MPFVNTPHGRHPVAATRFVAPVDAIIVGSSKIPGQKENGIRLEEVGFTVFYPANTSSGKKLRKGLRWLAGPLNTEIAGYGKFMGVSKWITWFIIAPLVYIYGRFIEIPVYRNAPMLPPEKDTKWPLVIFSHGLGGSPGSYSQFCVRLAASGRVVISMEHRDGTMPAVIASIHGQKRPLLYTKEGEVSWDDKPEDALPLRVDQLTIRQHEIYTAYEAFARLVSTPADSVDTGIDKNIQFIDKGADIKAWKNAPIKLTDICLTAHSFGGCTMFSILSSEPPKDLTSTGARPRLPVQNALILDPWLEPLPSPGPTPFKSKTRMAEPHANGHSGVHGLESSNGSINEAQHTRLLVITSEPFTKWKSHFDRLSEVVKGWGPEAKLLSLVKSAHTSFSDFHLLPLIRDKPSVRLMDMIVQLSLSFLDNEEEPWPVNEIFGHGEQGIEILDKVPDKVVVGKWPDGRDRTKWIGEVGQVVVH